jgi:hypothetical protein
MFIPRFRLKALYTSLLLMIGFTLYIILLLRFSSDLPCSCGGILEQLTWPQHIVFNSIFAFLAILAITLSKINSKHNKTISDSAMAY